MAIKLKSLNPAVVNATAQLIYYNMGHWREIIHEMKYRRSWRTAIKVGYWYGLDLAQSPLYQSIDMVIGIPLHPLRHLHRRYNQSEKIAKGIAQALGVEHNYSALRRIRNNPSQVSRHGGEQRWRNAESLFAVHDPKALENRDILLVDDVFTTGATMNSCIETILRSVPSCRVSVATIAIARRNFLGDI